MSKWVKPVDKPDVRYIEALWFSDWEECFLQIPMSEDNVHFQDSSAFPVKKEK